MRLVIFDVDGTLVDSQHNILEAQRRAFAAVGLAAPPRERALAVVGLSLPEAFAALVGAAGPVPALVAAYKAAWAALRREPGFSDPLYPGAADLIASLAGRDGVRLGLATGKSRPGVERLLDGRGWRSAFATVQTADEHPSKPHPSMLRRALAETAVEAGAAMFVGDTTFDMAMARAAGTAAIGVAWGYHDVAALRQAGAASIATDFTELRVTLDKMIANLL